MRAKWGGRYGVKPYEGRKDIVLIVLALRDIEVYCTMRTERDSMGEMSVPDDALYGASTQRAVLNFPISGHLMPDAFIRGLGLVKFACAVANAELGLIDHEKSLSLIHI